MTGRDWLLVAIVISLIVAVVSAVQANWLAFATAVGNAQACYGWRWARRQPKRTD